MAASKEKKYDRLGLIASISIHAALLLLFIFLLAWQAPDPPIPQYGIVVNIGTDNPGSGRVQPRRRPVETRKVREKEPEEPKPQKQEPVEEPVKETPEEVRQKPVEQPPEESAEKPVTQPEPSPVVEKKEKKTTPQKKVQPKKQTPEKKPEPPKKTQPTRKTPEKKPVDNNPPKVDGQGKSDKEPAKSNQGDRPGKTGDQGKPSGTVDSKALYGSQGGGSGSRLDLAGWNWDELPRPDDRSQESGRIVFEIKVDDQGEIIAVRTIEKTVSPAVEKIYRNEVENLTFHKTAGNTRPAPVSTGRITFIIKAN